MKQCSWNLAPQMCITKETKCHPWCCCHDNSFAADALLIKTVIPDFSSKQELSTPPNLMMGLKTIWELFLFQVGPFGQKSCYGNSTNGVILFLLWCTFMVPRFKNTASIFPEISFIQYFPHFTCKQYDVITDQICIIEKRRYL